MRKGFTLLEVMVASLLLAMLVTILTMIFNQSSIAWTTGTASVAGLGDVRRDMSKVGLVPSDLKGPGGAVIPADEIDLKVVKYWWRPHDSWDTDRFGDVSKLALMPVMLLHDDTLATRDDEKQVNFVRADYPTGPVYLNMRERGRETHFNYALEPVHDAPKLLPLDLRKGEWRELFLILHVPASATPGEYSGTLAVSENGKSCGSLGIRLTVHPFALPRPRTHYDTREPYVSYWMGSPSLDGLLAEGHRLDRAEMKLRAIYRNMAEHNAINLSGVGDLKVDSTDDYALRTLLIARQEGMCANPMINGSAWDSSHRFVCVPGGTAKDLLEPEEEPELYKKSLAIHRDFVTKQSAIMDKYLGHHNCYYSSPDECGYGTVRRSYGYMNLVHELGGLCWTDYGYADKIGVIDDINDVPASIDHRVAWGWHHCGAKCVTYAGTFTGPECPDVWRRNKGTRFWYGDFDGQHEYDFFDGGANRWNDFVRYGRYCQFGIVYWTQDGLVSTLAWEANREGLDDVRYFSLLRLRAFAALKSSDPETRRLGRAALVWQDAGDPELEPDLDKLRAKNVEWILKLIAKVGEEPPEEPTELPPPAVLPPEGSFAKVPKAGSSAKVIMDYAKERRNAGRWDLALVAYENLYRDDKAEPVDRAKAAIEASRLHSALQERAASLKALDAVTGHQSMPSAWRCKLLLQRVNALTTDEQFEDTLDLVRRVRFDLLFTFIFSPRVGTPAASMPDRAETEVAERRAELIMDLQGGIMDDYYASRIGETLKVLCTGEDGGFLTGRSYADSPDIDGTVYFEGDCAPGDFALVRITGLMDGELVGEQIY